jgi:HEPN domain-containing protein
MIRRDFQQLAIIRLKEAKVLLDNKCYHGSFYLSGYAVECALKACIAKKTKRFEFPDKNFAKDIYTHDLTILIKLSGLKDELDKEIKNKIDFATYWGCVKDWSETIRYNTNIRRQQALDAFNAISDNRYGILEWLKNFW